MSEAKNKNDAQDSNKKRRTEEAIQANIKYKPEYCDLLIKHMAKGMSFESFGAKANCGRATLYAWEKKYPEFKAAKKTATERALEFFETRLSAKIAGQDLSSQGIDTKKIDTTALIFALKTRFHETYGERQRIDHTTNGESMNLQVEFVKPGDGND